MNKDSSTIIIITFKNYYCDKANYNINYNKVDFSKVNLKR